MHCFSFERAWKSYFVPPKVGLFFWTLLRGRFLTIDNIKKRGMKLVNRCALCKVDEQLVKHLFTSCTVSRAVWNFFSTSFVVDFIVEFAHYGKTYIEARFVDIYSGKKVFGFSYSRNLLGYLD